LETRSGLQVTSLLCLSLQHRAVVEFASVAAVVVVVVVAQAAAVAVFLGINITHSSAFVPAAG
jgi:hypothetical protein